MSKVCHVPAIELAGRMLIKIVENVTTNYFQIRISKNMHLTCKAFERKRRKQRKQLPYFKQRAQKRFTSLGFTSNSNLCTEKNDHQSRPFSKTRLIQLFPKTRQLNQFWIGMTYSVKNERKKSGLSGCQKGNFTTRFWPFSDNFLRLSKRSNIHK